MTAVIKIAEEKSMLGAKLKNKQNNRRKGVTLVELGLFMVAAIFLLIGSVFAWGEIQFRMAKSDVVRDVIEINSAADSWKSFRPSYTGVSMTVLCAAGQQGISKSTCGGVGGNGSNTNPFGGSYTITVASNVSQKTMTVTGLPTERINEIADTLAPQTADECPAASGCSTLSVTANTITMTL